MNLQIALIVIGVMLIVVVYLVSVWRERGKSNAGGDNIDRHHADGDADGIPVLDYPVNGNSERHQSMQGDAGSDTIEQQAVRQNEPPKDLIEPEFTSYSDDRYSLDIPQRQDDLDWTDATSLTNLTDNSTELDKVLHTSIEEDIATEYAPESEQQQYVSEAPDGSGLFEEIEDAGATRDDSQVQNNDSEPQPISSSPRKYSYPHIDGFDRVCQLDYWVRLHGDSDVGRESVLAQFRGARSVLSKYNQLIGFKIPENNWCDLEQESEDARFDDLIITIQLADQNGPVSKAELDQFLNLVTNLAKGTNRSLAFMAPLESALQQANAIADFIRYYESVFSINVKPQQTDYLDGNAINLFATQLGLERGTNNYFIRNKIMSNAKVCLYSLANMSDSGEFDFDALSDFTTRGVIFFTKPAINQSPGAVFSEMVDTAKAFAGRIDGEAVAPDHEALSSEDVEQIRSSIEQVAQDMEEMGVAPGSDEAIRIF